MFKVDISLIIIRLALGEIPTSLDLGMGKTHTCGPRRSFVPRSAVETGADMEEPRIRWSRPFGDNRDECEV